MPSVSSSKSNTGIGEYEAQTIACKISYRDILYNMGILEKEMAIHSSTLAWKIPWMEEPGGLHTVRGVVKSRT